jgi:hypothetical protein
MRRARFVTAEAYVEAGGVVVTDLFRADSNSYDEAERLDTLDHEIAVLCERTFVWSDRLKVKPLDPGTRVGSTASVRTATEARCKLRAGNHVLFPT